MARIARRERDRDRVLELIGLLDDHPKPPLWWGPLRAELVGIRSLIDGRVPDAVAGFNEALSHFSKAELRPHEMETAWEAGVALAEANEPAHAHAFLRRAHEVAQTLGLEIPAGRLADIVLHLTLGAEATALPAAGEEPDTLVRVATVLNSLLDFPVLLTQSLELVCTRVGAERGFTPYEL